MKIKKQITIVADVLVDENLDINDLCICQNTTPEDIHDTYAGISDEFEVLDYISQEAIEMVVENPLDTITDNAFDESGDICDVCKKCGTNNCGNDTLNHACFEGI